jgi:hypothetical protein
MVPPAAGVGTGGLLIPEARAPKRHPTYTFSLDEPSTTLPSGQAPRGSGDDRGGPAIGRKAELAELSAVLSWTQQDLNL